MSSPQTATPTTANAAARRARVETILLLAAVAAATIVAACLRLHAIGEKSFWTDEGVSAALMRLDWYNFGRIVWRREANMGLYYLLLRAWGQLGDSVAWIRALSAVAAMATIPVLYGVGKRLFGTAAGILGALLMAVNAYHVRYAQEARSYSLVTLLVTVATYFFIRAVQENRRNDWKWYIVSSVLAIYAHFFAVLVVVAHWTSLRVAPMTATASGQPQSADGGAALGVSAVPALRDFYAASKCIALWTLPVWIFIATTGAGPIRWIQRPGPRDLYRFVEELAGNGGAALFWLYVACAALAVIAALREWRRAPHSAECWHYAVALTWFFVPVFVALVFSFARPVFLPRYLIITLPALVLTATAGLLHFQQRWMAAPVFALIVWFALLGVHSYYKKDFDISREDFKGVAGYVLQHAQPGDAILFYKAQGRFPYSYYASHFAAGNRPMIISPGHGDQPEWRDFMGKVTPQVLESATRDYPRVWLVLTQNLAPGGEDQITQQIKTAITARYRLIDQHGFTGITVYLYAP